MGLSYGVFVQAFLLAVGLVWCKEMFSKSREHLEEFRTGDWPRRIALLLLWVLTVLILLACVHFIYVVGFRIWQGLQKFRGL